MKLHSYLLLAGSFALVCASSGCGRDPCLTDQFEPNEDFDSGVDLGFFSDQETNMKFELTLDRPDDHDVFFFNVQDAGSDGNPELEVWVEGQDGEQLTLEIEYQCTNDPMVDFECNGEVIESPRAGEFGRICRIASSGEVYLDINYDCEGNLTDDDDSGFAIVTVSRTNPPTACAAYNLEINTD